MNAPLSRLRLPVASFAFVLLLVASVSPAMGAQSPNVTGFTLINADNDRPVSGFDPIAPGSTLNLATLPTRNLNIRANTGPGVGSVQMRLNTGTPVVENQQPYALGGDQNGNFRPWTPTAGSHTVTATAFPQRGAGGTGGPTIALTFAVVDTPTSGPPPPTTASSSNCGAMPTAPAGWQRRVTSSFSETTALGSWPGAIAARDWRSRTAGYKDSSGRGTYNSAKTVSEHHGVLDIWVHSEGNTRYIAAPIPRIGDTVGQRISLCMRADRIPGYKIAFLLWPDVGPGNYHGEINFPEGKLTPDGVANAFMHYDPKPATGKQQDAYNTGQSTTDWHAYTMEWDPARAVASFYVDGRLIGRSVGARVPDGPMHYIMQVETYVRGQALPAPAQGHILIDWVTIDVPSAGSGGQAAARQLALPPHSPGVT